MAKVVQKDNSFRRPVFIASAVASGMMLLFGLGYRAIAARIQSPVNTTPVAQEALDQLPLEIGDWVGSDTPVDANIIERTDTDAHVSRRYAMNAGSGVVSLWIAAGVQARDLMPHRPEVCYVGSGYTLVKHETPDLDLRDGTLLPCNVMEFSRGVLNRERVLVFYYYLVDGEYCRDVSDWRYKAMWTRIGYVAQVQVVTAISDASPPEIALRNAREFAVVSAPLIADLFQDARKAGESE